MSIKQIIKYNSTNKYFAGFINNYLQEAKLKASISQDNYKIELLIDDTDTKKLNNFTKNITKYLPHSIFLQDSITEKSNNKISSNIFISPSYPISLCLECLEKINDPSSEDYLSDNIKCLHYSNKEEYQENNSSIFSPHYSENNILLLCDFSKINDLFILTKNEKKALFSIEKPILKITIKDKKLKEITKRNYINIRVPYNIKSVLNAINAKDSEMSYLFFEDKDIDKIVLVQDKISIIRDSKISNKLNKFNEINTINRFVNIAKEINTKNAIGAYLSVKNEISFMISNELGSKEVIKINKFDLEKFLEDMKNDKLKSKLLKNFTKKYPQIINELNINYEYDLFQTLSVICELNYKGFEALSDKSLEFQGNGGLKIDMFYKKDKFDYVSFLGSIMSFKLALTNNDYLAYSIFEAYGDFAISTLNQLKKKFDIDKIIIMGDMFRSSILYSRILSKFKFAKPYFSKSYALDD